MIRRRQLTPALENADHRPADRGRDALLPPRRQPGRHRSGPRTRPVDRVPLPQARPRREHRPHGDPPAATFGRRSGAVALAGRSRGRSRRRPGPRRHRGGLRVEGLLRNGMRLGISWGRTRADVLRQLRPGAAYDLSIAQLAGASRTRVSGSRATSSCAGWPSSTPAHESTISTRRPSSNPRPRERPSWATGSSRRLCRPPERASSPSSASARWTTSRRSSGGGHVSPADWARLRAVGAAGNVNTCFFDAHGRVSTTCAVGRSRSPSTSSEPLTPSWPLAGRIGKARAHPGRARHGRHRNPRHRRGDRGWGPGRRPISEASGSIDDQAPTGDGRPANRR